MNQEAIKRVLKSSDGQELVKFLQVKLMEVSDVKNLSRVPLDMLGLEARAMLLAYAKIKDMLAELDIEELTSENERDEYAIY